jgi:hypothetical protein
LIVRHSIVPFALAVVVLSTGQCLAQGGFPAPLPGQSQANSSPFPPINGNSAPAVAAAPSAPFPSGGTAPFGGGMQPRPMGAPQGGDNCMKDFLPLREEAARRGELIKAASDRKASPDEACKLIGNFGKAEMKMIKYVEAHAASCGIPQQIADQLKNGHKNTEKMQKQVCNVAAQIQQRGPAGPSLSDVLGSSASLPEANTAKKGGSTFDTLNGNVLTR